MFLCLPLHLFAPSLHPLGFVVKELHEPAAVPAKRGHTACFGTLQAGFDQPGFRLWARGPTGRPIVLSVTEQALCAHCTDGPILRGSAGLRVATEATTELQAFVLHGGKPLQFHVCLHCSGHTVGALEPPMPNKNNKEMWLMTDMKNMKYEKRWYEKNVDVYGYFASFVLHTVFYLPLGSLLNGTEEGLYYQSQSLSQFPPGKYRQQYTFKLPLTTEMHSQEWIANRWQSFLLRRDGVVVNQ